MSDMQLNEVWERFDQGMRKAASRARELGTAQKNKDWLNMAAGFDGIRKKGEILFKSKALSRHDVLTQLDQIQKNKAS